MMKARTSPMRSVHVVHDPKRRVRNQSNAKISPKMAEEATDQTTVLSRPPGK
jgi:hypothetical protein